MNEKDPFETVDIMAVCLGILVIALVLLLCSCSVTLRTDGSRTYQTDPDAFLRAVQIIAEK